MKSLGYVGREVTVKIDRPLGATHPRRPGFVFETNLGFLPRTNQNAYVLGVFEPVEEFSGECIAVIHRVDTREETLVVVPPGLRLSDSEIRLLTWFQERHFQAEIRRP